MIRYKNYSRLFFIIFTIYLTLAWQYTGATTPPVTPADRVWSDPTVPGITLGQYRQQPPVPHRDFGNYVGQFESICFFLDQMQEHNVESNAYGGLHEGEGRDLWAIIETDNTQESIRAWCIYSQYFEDMETFADNIQAAWTYCDSFPAWEESPPGEMYALHNCGWGLIAEMAYRELFGDDRREYGLRCADHLVEHTPHIEVNQEDRLMPLVAGWGAGTLYEFALLEDNEEYLNAAIRIADEVKEWIDEDRNRLNSNEIWALCGGTAMWGVLHCLGGVDSAATTGWAIEALEDMDVFAGNGRWNNSWNIWYTHAWIEAWKLTGSVEYRDNAVIILDSLIAQDTDGDGGIPATIGDPDNRDQSWVSAYTAWMGLSNLFDELPPFSTSLVSLVEPDINRPYPILSSLHLVFEAVNEGLNETVQVPLRIRGSIEYDTTFTLNGWQPIEVTIADPLNFNQPGQYPFTVYLDHEEEFDRSNDTLRFTMDVLSVTDITLRSNNRNGDPVRCRFDFYNLDLDPEQVFASLEADSMFGVVRDNVMFGNYRLVATPVFPYAVKTVNNLDLRNEIPVEISLTFEQPPILLIDRDIDTTNAVYYTESLDDWEVPYYHWRSDIEGHIGNRTAEFQSVIYFTGDSYQDDIVPEADQEELTDYMQNGGNLFITGQNIADDLNGTSFLEETLHSLWLADDIRASLVEGIPGDEVLGGDEMLLIGNMGSNNQTSPAGLTPAEGGIACARYQNHGDTASAVRWEEPDGGRGVFFAFGFEGISGQYGDSRQQIMRELLDWLGTPYSVDQEISPVIYPQQIRLSSVYPNPSNDAVRIQLSDSPPYPVQLRIIDISGRLVARIEDIRNGVACWNGLNYRGFRAPSGQYFLLLTGLDGDEVFSTGSFTILR